jgi:hypothetical protein
LAANSSSRLLGGFDRFVRETTVKLHESFLLSLQAFAGKYVKPSKPAAAAASPAKPPLPGQDRFVHVERADLRPMRFNITFGLSSGSLAGLEDFLERFPLLSAAVGALASVSDAPLRLDGVKLLNESKPASALIAALQRWVAALPSCQAAALTLRVLPADTT